MRKRYIDKFSFFMAPNLPYEKAIMTAQDGMLFEMQKMNFEKVIKEKEREFAKKILKKVLKTFHPLPIHQKDAYREGCWYIGNQDRGVIHQVAEKYGINL